MNSAISTPSFSHTENPRSLTGFAQRLRQLMETCEASGPMLAAEVRAGAGGTSGRAALPRIDRAAAAVVKHLRRCRLSHGKVLTIGNGGSCVIAEHIAVDLANRAGTRTRTCGSAPQLSALANDNHFEHAFAMWVDGEADAGDTLVAVSSSGESVNIRNAVRAARERGCTVVTFSGFSPDNPLRTLGDLNFYVSSSHYGEVEVTHEAIAHFITDECVDLAARDRSLDADAGQQGEPAPVILPQPKPRPIQR